MAFFFRIPPLLGLIIAVAVLAAVSMGYYFIITFFVILAVYAPWAIGLFVLSLLLPFILRTQFKRNKWGFRVFILVSLLIMGGCYVQARLVTIPMEREIYEAFHGGDRWGYASLAKAAFPEETYKALSDVADKANLSSIRHFYNQPHHKVAGLGGLPFDVLPGVSNYYFEAEKRKELKAARRCVESPQDEGKIDSVCRSLEELKSKTGRLELDLYAAPMSSFFDGETRKVIRFMDRCTEQPKGVPHLVLKDDLDCNSFKGIEQRTGRDLKAELDEDFLQIKTLLPEILKIKGNWAACGGLGDKPEYCPVQNECLEKAASSLCLCRFNVVKNANGRGALDKTLNCPQYNASYPAYALFMKGDHWTPESCNFSKLCSRLAKAKVQGVSTKRYDIGGGFYVENAEGFIDADTYYKK